MNPLTETPPDKHAALRDELATLATEESNASYDDLDMRSTADLVQAMNREDASVHAAVAQAAPAIAQAIDETAERMIRGGRLLYIGAGTPGRLGILDASECPPTFGTDPTLVQGIIAGGPAAIHTAVENAEDDESAGRYDIARAGVSAVDTVVGISASGRTPYVLGALEAAKTAGALTVSIAGNANSVIGRAVDVAIDVEVGPEFIAGSTRLKAGTAQKMVLNMLSTITMIRLGKIYGNQMVDLVATNDKLRARSERTVISATGVSAAAASEALSAADGSVKLAILMLLTGCEAPEAAEVLSQHRGHLRPAASARRQ